MTAANAASFSGFNTLVGIQHLILNSAKDPASGGYVDGFYGDGFWSLATVFMVQTAANWIAPSVIALVGPRLVMFLSAITYVLFKAQLLVLNTELLYASSVLVGLGAGLMWTTQGHFLAINSDDNTIPQNSGIFWAMLMGSGLTGHAFVYFQFKGSEDIASETRTVVSLCSCEGEGVWGGQPQAGHSRPGAPEQTAPERARARAAPTPAFIAAGGASSSGGGAGRGGLFRTSPAFGVRLEERADRLRDSNKQRSGSGRLSRP